MDLSIWALNAIKHLFISSKYTQIPNLMSRSNSKPNNLLVYIKISRVVTSAAITQTNATLQCETGASEKNGFCQHKTDFTYPM